MPLKLYQPGIKDDILLWVIILTLSFAFYKAMSEIATPRDLYIQQAQLSFKRTKRKKEEADKVLTRVRHRQFKSILTPTLQYN